METDWSVAAGADDPVLELPWRDDESGLAWTNLQMSAEAQKERMAAIPEAVASPALADSLALLNAPQGLLLTTKCDRWLLDEEERADLADALDAPPAACGYGSYIDVLTARAIPMTDLLLHEGWARLTAMRCAAVAAEDARMELVVRPACSKGIWGYGITLYCYACGMDEAHAETAWASALKQITPVLIEEAENLLASADDANQPGRLS
ncbi:MAG TPA: hypothetical protein VF126_00475 [Acidobacteriaceae bacterium]